MRRAKKSFFLHFFSLLRYRLTVFLPPLPKVGCPIFFEIWNPWGKKWKEVVSYMTIFVWKLSKIAAQKKFFSLTFFTFEVPFNGHFAPTSQSRMSNIFRDLVSLGKSNWKKWSNIWTFLFGSGLKSPRKKKVFFSSDFALFHPPMATVLLSASVERCFVSRMRDIL